MIFKNKIYIIIGSEGLIGKTFRKHILNNGGKICSVDILKKSKNVSNNELYIKANITNSINIKKILNKTKKRFKKIDCIINCSYPKKIKARILNLLIIKI